jgi:flagellar biosynthesis/type III secretory pathway M-ring protein FliF/YscJ
VTPALRLAASLVVSLLMWLPTVPAALTAHEDPSRLAGRYLLALLVARIGVGIVFRIVKAYAPPEVDAEDEQDAPPPVVDDERPGEPVPFGRRRNDDASPTEEALLDEALDDVEDTAALAH